MENGEWQIQRTRKNLRQRAAGEMLLVAIPRNAVDADSCPTGCGEIMSPHHLGGQVAREAANRRREWLLVRGAPGLFRVGPQAEAGCQGPLLQPEVPRSQWQAVL